MFRIALSPTCALVAGLLLASPAGAAEIYLGGALGNSTASGTGSASSDLFDVEGDDQDSSPSYGGTLGLAFAMDEALPAIKTFELPSWVVRTELEFLTGRDYEFLTNGVGAGDEFLTEFNAWTIMPNVSVEIPMRDPIQWLFGRIPVLEPMSLYGNVGIGMAAYELSATDNISRTGSQTDYNFAWQGGAGITYQLTDTISFVLGYRYLSLGTAEAVLKDINPEGDYSIDVSSHELVSGLRLGFYSAPLQDMHPRNWGKGIMRRMPSWLGGPSGEGDDEDERKSDADDL